MDRARPRPSAGSRRVLSTAVGAIAAAAVAVVVVGSVVRDERTTLRTPAAPAADGADHGAGGPTTVPAPTTVPSPATTAAGRPRRHTAAVDGTGDAPRPSSRHAASGSRRHPATAPPVTRTFTSRGGSIVVRHDGGTIVLDGDPSPSSGWTYRVDDDGPTRVRVRFETDDGRSEIRIDLEDGELVPTIVED